MEEAGSVLLSKLKSISCPQGATLKRFWTQPQIVGWTSRRGEVEKVVDRTGVKGFADTLFKQRKAGFVAQVSEISRVSSREIVQANNGMAVFKQCIAQMRAKETRRSRYEISLVSQVLHSPFGYLKYPNAETPRIFLVASINPLNMPMHSGVQR